MTENDDSQFVDLLTSHQSIIRAYVITLLPGSPGVDDVIQNTNRSIWINRNNFKLGTNFKAWSFTMARDQVMAYRKTIKRQRLVSLDDDVLDLLAKSCENDDDNIDDRHEALKGCLAKLKPDDRQLILHRYWSKTPLHDYALISKLSLGSWKTRLFRIREALKKCISTQLQQQSLPPETI